MCRDMAQQTPPPDIMEGLTGYRQSCRRADGIHRVLFLSPPLSTYQLYCHLCAPSQVAIVWNSACFKTNGSVPQYASTLNESLHSCSGEWHSGCHKIAHTCLAQNQAHKPNRFSHNSSLLACVTAMNSTSVVFKATYFCNLLCHATAP
jgi:hypothetical protein